MDAGSIALGVGAERRCVWAYEMVSLVSCWDKFGLHIHSISLEYITIYGTQHMKTGEQLEDIE